VTAVTGWSSSTALFFGRRIFDGKRDSHFMDNRFADPENRCCDLSVNNE
jgi:hypothetical protein